MKREQTGLKNKAADTPQMRRDGRRLARESGPVQGGAAPRLPGVDGRCRAAKQWRAAYRDLMARTGGRHEILCKSAASLTVRRAQLDSEIARGESVDVLGLVRISNSLTRIMRVLGLVSQEEPIDATEAAIAALREQREVA